MFAGKKSAQIREILINESAWEEMTCLFAPSLGIFVRKYAELGFYETLSLTANFIIIIILCWGGYRVFTPRRNNVSHGDTRLISQRIFWQIVFPATLFLVMLPTY
nr:hypothetical protein [Escherichia coli]